MAFSDVVTYIESLPSYNSPDIFGMTDNAEKACRELQADDLMNTVVSVQPRLSMGLIGYFCFDAFSHLLSPVYFSSTVTRALGLF